MKKSLRSALALAVASAIPLFAIAPATALTRVEASDLLQIVDCDTIGPDGEGFVVGLWSDPTTVILAHCDGYYVGDAEGTDAITIDDGVVTDAGDMQLDDPSEWVEFGDVAELTILEVSGDSPMAGVRAIEILDMGNPNGTRLLDSSITVPLESEEFTIGTADEIDNEDDIYIDGDDTCTLAAGPHMYTMQRFHVSEAGEYTFRVVGTDPVSSYIQAGTYTPWEDPMIALYEGEFDPADPDAAVAGCNDDFNDLTIDGFDWSVPNDEEVYDRVYAITEDDKALEGHFPVFTAELEPGDYTMLVTTFGTLTSSQWTEGEDAYGSWEPAEATIEYEVWGPEDGAAPVDEFELASTGVEPGLALWSGLALAGTGVAIAAARRNRKLLL